MRKKQEKFQKIITEVKQFLRKNPANKKLTRFLLPKKQAWILLLGEPGAGKTSLMTQNQAQLIPVNNTESDHTFNFWLKDDTVFVDPPTDSELHKQDNVALQREWNILLKNCKFSAIAVVIDFPSLCTSDDNLFMQLVTHFKKQIQRVEHLPYKQMPVMILVSQCDRIMGFNDFFDDLNPDERKTAHGFDLSKDFSQQFTDFIEQQSNRLMWRLHHEQGLSKRYQIKEYPFQLEYLKKPLGLLAGELSKIPHTYLTGIYFCSNQQTGSPIDLLTTESAAQLSLFHFEPKTATFSKKAFFGGGAIQHLLHHALHPLTSTRTMTWRYVVTYPIAIIIIGVSALLWHQSYQQNVAILNQANNDLLLFIANDKSPVPWLKQMNATRKILSDLSYTEPQYSRWLGLPQMNDIRAKFTGAYQQALTIHLLPFLKETLTTELQQDVIQKNQLKLYSTLKVYLMLSHPEHFNATLIEQWFTEAWQQKYIGNPDIASELSLHLHNLLQMQKPSWAIDQKLVASAQAELAELSPAQIVFIELQQSFPQTQVPILEGVGNIDGIDLSSTTIPAFYNQKYFKQIYQDTIPKLSQSITQDNWVLGIENGTPLSPTQADLLIKQVQQIYLDNYTQQWLQALDRIKLTPPNSIDEAQARIKLLTDPHSAFWQLLTIVVANARLNQTIETHAKPSASLATIQTFINPMSVMQQNVVNVLNHLNDYLFHITETNTIDKASFDSAVKRFSDKSRQDEITAVLDLSKKMPAPINNWLASIAQGSWQSVLNEARHYINLMWQTNILPFYQQNIDGLYPVFPDATGDISLQNFTAFFGPNGLIDQFFNKYLIHFVNMEQSYWVWQEQDGAKMPLPQEVLDEFIRASLIQQMFFLDNPTQPNIDFELRPEKLSDEVASFTLNIGGVVTEFNATTATSQSFHWPVPNAYFATLLFASTNGQTATVTTNGVWAWLRLLDKASVQSTNQPQEFQLTFQLGNYSVNYLLIANHRVNPYIPGILTKFRCPTEL